MNTSASTTSISTNSASSTSSVTSSAAVTEKQQATTLSSLLETIKQQIGTLEEYKKIESDLRIYFIDRIKTDHEFIKHCCNCIHDLSTAMIYKNTCVTVCDDVVQWIEATVANIKIKANSDNTGILAINFLGEIKNHYDILKSTLIPPQIANPDQILWEKEHLRLEQQLIHQHHEVSAIFNATLQKIQKHCADNCRNREITQFAHPISVPPQKNNPTEKWVEPFLDILWKDLKIAGIDKFLCTDPMLMKYSNHLVIGTESLLRCYRVHDNQICIQLSEVNAMPRSSTKVIPILLSGTPETSFPEYYRGEDIDIKYWCEQSYQTNFKLLLRQFIQNISDDVYQKLWEEFESKYSSLTRPFSQKVVKIILKDETTEQLLTHTKHDRRNLQLYQESKNNSKEIVPLSTTRRSNSFSAISSVTNSTGGVDKNGSDNTSIKPAAPS